MIKTALTTVLCAALATASTTMCFKKGHMDPSNIETIPLDGGECQGMLSVADMKKQGYNVDDIKITAGENGMNYLYVFSKQKVIIGGANTKAPSGTQVLTKEQLKSYLNELKEEEALEAKRKEELGDITKGKELYESTCKQCHGSKGEIRAYNVARPLNSLSFEEAKLAIREYTLDERKGTMALLMIPYATILTDQKLKNITSYLKTLN